MYFLHSLGVSMEYDRLGLQRVQTSKGKKMIWLLSETRFRYVSYKWLMWLVASKFLPTYT